MKLIFSVLIVCGLLFMDVLSWPGGGWRRGDSSSSERRFYPRPTADGITEQCSEILANTTTILSTLADQLFAYYTQQIPEITDFFAANGITNYPAEADNDFLAAVQKFISDVSTLRSISVYITDCKRRLFQELIDLNQSLEKMREALQAIADALDDAGATELRDDLDAWIDTLADAFQEKNNILGCFVVPELPSPGEGGNGSGGPGEGEQFPLGP